MRTNINNIKLRSLALVVMLGASVGAQTTPAAGASTAPVERVSSVAVDRSDPAEYLRQVTRAVRNDDLHGLLQVMLTPTEYQKARASYDSKRLSISESDKAEFNKSWSQLVAPDAVDQFMLKIEPELEKARPQYLGGVMMAMGALQMAIARDDSELTPSQRESLKTLTPALQSWLMETDFLSSQTLRQAANIVVGAARSSGIRDWNDASALSFDQALAKAESMMIAVKRSSQLYQFDINKVLDSLRFELVSRDGDRAIVRSSVTLFNTDISGEQEWKWAEGRWEPAKTRKAAAHKVEKG